MSVPTPSGSEPIANARRELHELTILSGALLRLATRVQSRCDALRQTLGDTDPITGEEIDRFAPEEGSAPASATAGIGQEDDPAELMAISLAGEGMTRDQIADYLRQSFGMQETDDLLDRVLPEHA